jgi:hypothetical protein
VSIPHEGVTEGNLTVGDCNATISTEYPICTDLGLDPDMRGERPRLVTEPEKREKTVFDSMSYSVDRGRRTDEEQLLVEQFSEGAVTKT